MAGEGWPVGGATKLPQGARIRNGPDGSPHPLRTTPRRRYGSEKDLNQRKKELVAVGAGEIGENQPQSLRRNGSSIQIAGEWVRERGDFAGFSTLSPDWGKRLTRSFRVEPLLFRSPAEVFLNLPAGRLLEWLLQICRAEAPGVGSEVHHPGHAGPLGIKVGGQGSGRPAVPMAVRRPVGPGFLVLA